MASVVISISVISAKSLLPIAPIMPIFFVPTIIISALGLLMVYSIPNVEHERYEKIKLTPIEFDSLDISLIDSINEKSKESINELSKKPLIDPINEQSNESLIDPIIVPQFKQDISETVDELALIVLILLVSVLILEKILEKILSFIKYLQEQFRPKKRFEREFNLIKQIGSGQFGDVVEVENKNNKMKFAIKKIPFTGKLSLGN